MRRATELQNLSAYDFFIGRDATVARRFYYTPAFEAVLLEMPRVLAAFDSRWGDARTNLTTYLQLQLQTDRDDDKADGVLNGPTTEAWFDHWYRHLVELGVRFARSGVDCLVAPRSDRGDPPHRRPRVQVKLTEGTRLAPDYVVVAVDAPAAERITAPLRAAGTGGTVAGLDGFTTSVPPPGGPLQPTPGRPSARRDPYTLNEMGRVPWDRFQTLAGIQYFFDTEFQLLRGHMYYSGTEWGLSSINQSGMWERQRTLARDGHVSVLSVDIGDFNNPSRHLVDEFGRGKAARDCTADELAQEVWRQINHAITSDADNVPEALLPWPAWYALDRNLRMTASPNTGTPARNEAPYLIPIVGDWPNRPGCDPWNPHGSSWTTRPTEIQWLENLEQRDVWQARHGGYQVHHNSVVFAGTWNKTFTRMTSMEAACESARHAVNAILDHYVWVESGGIDRREKTILNWRLPYGFLDQGFSSPIRLPTPAGDYCYVFDIENREPYETRTLRNLDSQYCLASQPHPIGSFGCQPGPPRIPCPFNPRRSTHDVALDRLCTAVAFPPSSLAPAPRTDHGRHDAFAVCAAARVGDVRPAAAVHAAADAGRGTWADGNPANGLHPATAHLSPGVAAVPRTNDARRGGVSAPTSAGRPAAGRPSVGCPFVGCPSARCPTAGRRVATRLVAAPSHLGFHASGDGVRCARTWLDEPHRFPQGTEPPEGESFPGSGSLYQPSRSLLPSSPVGEYQPNSAYVSAHRRPRVGGCPERHDRCTQSRPARGSGPGGESGAVGPVQLEIVKPSIELTK